MRRTLLYSLPPLYTPLQHETHLVVFLAPSLHPITTRDPPCRIPCPLVAPHYNMRPTLSYSLPPLYTPLQHETHLVVFLAPSLHPIAGLHVDLDVVARRRVLDFGHVNVDGIVGRFTGCQSAMELGCDDMMTEFIPSITLRLLPQSPKVSEGHKP